MTYKKCLFALILSFGSLLGLAQPIVWNPAMREVSIGRRISILTDSSQKLTIEQVSSRDFDGRFKVSTQKNLRFSEANQLFWLKFEVENPQKIPLVLVLEQSVIPIADFYFKTDTSQQWQVQKGGSRINLYEKSINHHHQAFRLPAQSGTFYLRVSGSILVMPISIKQEAVFETHTKHQLLVNGLYIGLMLFVALHNLFLYFSFRQSIYLHYAIYVFCMLIFITLNYGLISYLLPDLNVKTWYINFSITVPMIGLMYAMQFLRIRHYAPRLMPFGIGILVILGGGLLGSRLVSEAVLQYVMKSAILALFVFVMIAAIVVKRKGNRVGYYFALTYFIFCIFFGLNSIQESRGDLPILLYVNYIGWGILLEVLLQSFLLTKQFEWEKADSQAEKARSQAQLLEKTLENEQIVREQNLILENKVAERTAELEQSLNNLQETKNQLVQQEKLASLGELTAGIAHEIQNPLNFVNNFSELSIDLVKDLKEELQKSDKDATYIDELFEDLSQNQTKINQHGKRASRIVKGMLGHSRTNTGERVLTDLNALCDEYLRLSYHGMRAKNKAFNADYKMVLDPNLPQLNVVAQDIGRVLLNLINNAFYAVNDKKTNHTGGGNYQPLVVVSSLKKDNLMEIKVSDNGNGIPESIKSKIFLPFFTTKPSGEGTGLGLSLSYDIITKGHNGTLEVESTEGVGTTFILTLPIN